MARQERKGPKRLCLAGKTASAAAFIEKGMTMATANKGDTVQIHYTGTLADGSVFDSSEGRDPLSFEVGSGMIIPGLDVAIPGMAVGDKKTVQIPADQAYGPEHPEARQAIPRSELPDDIPQEVGTRLQMQNPEGQVVAVVIAEVTETDIIIDANHPLAGKDLTFQIEMMAIQPG